MKNKKVIFVDARDVISIPSKGSEPRNYADFHLNYCFIEALRKHEDIAHVNIIHHHKEYDSQGEETWRTLLRIVGYAISSIAYKATLNFPSYIEECCFEQAAEYTKKIDSFRDEATWLFVGSEERAKKYNVDYVSLADFINGAD